MGSWLGGAHQRQRSFICSPPAHNLHKTGNKTPPPKVKIWKLWKSTVEETAREAQGLADVPAIQPGFF